MMLHETWVKNYDPEHVYRQPKFNVVEGGRYGQIQTRHYSLLDAVLYAARAYVNTGLAPDIFDDEGREFEDIQLWAEAVTRAKQIYPASLDELEAEALVRAEQAHAEADRQRRRQGLQPKLSKGQRQLTAVAKW